MVGLKKQMAIAANEPSVTSIKARQTEIERHGKTDKHGKTDRHGKAGKGEMEKAGMRRRKTAGQRWSGEGRAGMERTRPV